VQPPAPPQPHQAGQDQRQLEAEAAAAHFADERLAVSRGAALTVRVGVCRDVAECREAAVEVDQTVTVVAGAVLALGALGERGRILAPEVVEVREGIGGG
jgi:hypothetical protein